jgi:hypothetical protein
LVLSVRPANLYAGIKQDSLVAQLEQEAASANFPGATIKSEFNLWLD